MAEAVATCAAETLVSKLVECLIAPIGRQFGYVLCYNSYVQGLEDGLKELEAERERVQSSVDEAVNNGKRIHTFAKNWLKSVKEETEKADELLKRGASAKSACFRGWLPNPVVRHPIGRKVKEMIPVIQKLREESLNSKFQKVFYENPPTGIVPAANSDATAVESKEDVLESRAKIMEEVMKALADDEVSVIGVWGLPGVGKSKLLDNVKERVKKDGKPFDLVAMAKLSRDQDLRTIQEEIADALGLHQMNEKSDLGRAERLRERLENGPEKNILIIIDNLWKKLELKEVGIPCGDDNKVRGCKLLLSSRYQHVLRDDMCCDPPFLPLKELEHGEARILFENIVGNKVHDPEFEPLVDGVVKNCGGLPLLIVPLAKRLKHKDLPAWRNALTNIDVSDVKSMVELNYSDLKDERTKLLFLVCALVSGRIWLRDALVYCMGLGLLKKFSGTIDNARDMLFEDLQTLQDFSLLLESNNTECFRMHDKILDVASSMHDKFMDMNWSALVARKDNGFKEWSKDELRRCTAMSFPFVGIDELPENLECPNLRVLLLFQNKPSLKVPESFFQFMEKLQVLDFTGLSFNSLPSSIELLKNLNSLSLDHCQLEDVTVLGKLVGLQVLSLQGSKIARLPKEIGELTELRFLDLRRCFWLQVIDPGVLDRLVNLEELYIDRFYQWEAQDEAPRSNASLAELKNMKKLRTLYIVIPRSDNLSSDLPLGKLNKYQIQIGGIPDTWGPYNESNILKLELDSDNLLHEVWMQKCLQLTHDLHLNGLQDGEDSIHKLCTEGFQELKHLRVQNNATFKYVVDSTPVFTKLQSLFLKNLHKLEKICRGVFAPESFGKLKIVKVENCGEIKHSFPSSMMRIFLQLEEIEISGCHSMQQIVAHAEANENEIDDEPSVKSCELRRLTLQNLPKVTSFCKTVDHGVAFFNERKVSLPKLESLTMSELPKLKEIWNSRFPSDVSNLKFLKVEGCAFLLSIFPSNFLLKLQNLEALTVERCELIREVFDLEILTASGDAEILPRLTILTLSGLPRLGHIWNNNPRRALCFQNLRALKVQNCENLTFLFSSSMAKALVQIKEIEIASCALMEEIMNVQEEESEEDATVGTLEFPLLTSLSLKELPNLRTFSYGKYCIQCPSLIRLMISGCPKMTTFSSFKRKQQSINANLQSSASYALYVSHPLFDEKSVFPKLEELHINGVQQEELWSDKILKESFCHLKVLKVKQCPNLMNVIPSFMWKRLLPCVKSLTVEKCPRLRHLFTMPMAKSLGQLQYLGLGGCGEMEYIVASKEEKPEEATNRIVIPQLVTLYLHNMPKLRSFCQGKYISKWPSLKEFIVKDCKAVEVILRDSSCRKPEDSVPTQQPLLLVEKVEFPSMESMKISHMDNVEKIWLGELASNAFTKLKTLAVEDCEKLSTIFSSYSNLTRFQNLEKITMTNCGSLEVVFHVQEVDFTEAQCTSTFQLRELVLTRLQKMKHVWSGLPHGGLIFGCLLSMTVVKCESLKSLFPSAMAKNMTKLKKLLVRDCGVEKIIVEEDGVGMNASDLFFPQLTDLRLLELPELRSFCSNSHTSTWPLLKQLGVRDCGKMRPFSFSCEFQSCQDTPPGKNQHALISFEKVIPQLEGSTLRREDVAMLQQQRQQHHTFAKLRELALSCYHDENDAFPSDFLLQRFPNLEYLGVICSSFDEIFPEDASGHGGGSVKQLGNLKRLNLYKLRNLRRVWKDGSLMAKVLKQTVYLLVEECPRLSIVFPSPTSFHRLMHLVVSNCAGLVHIGTCSAVTSLVHLTELILRECDAMKDVVTDDGNGVEEISFPKLRQLTLDSLPSLESFSPADCVFKFPSLVRVVIKQCPKMNIFCKGALRTPKVLLSYEDNEGRWDGDLNTTIETFSA